VKTELKVGDRVRVYGREWNGVGAKFYFDGSVDGFKDGNIIVDTPETTFHCHPKQCRRLRPKKRREWWVEIDDLGQILWGRDHKMVLGRGTEVIHVREVKKP
jgi:hypothetical protein